MQSEKNKRLLKLLGAEFIENIKEEEIDFRISEKYINEGVFFLNKGEMVLERKPELKDIITPSILKIKEKENVKKIYIIYRTEFTKLKSNLIQHNLQKIDLGSGKENEEEEEDAFDNSAADQLLYEILFSAKVRGVSDVHILPKKNKTVIKFRENGSLIVYKEFKKYYCKYIINRIKSKANLNITNKQTPQDGKFRVEIDKENLELRVSTANTIFGENAVLRVQQTTSLFDITLNDIGFEPEDLKIYRNNFKNPYGMILNVGSTGQGKTTTFYLTINELFQLYPDKNISTAEDPVEIIFENAVQFEVNDLRGLTFAKVLKALLRQDPDIILIGEIRDEETAAIAIKAAMTGHLVLATLHATDASNAFPRLRDIGISAQQISSTVSCVLSQRLVRKLCSCKKEIKVTNFMKEQYNLQTDKVYEANGCDLCQKTGYKGRAAVIEVLEVNESLKIGLSENKSEVELKKIIKNFGFKNLWKNGLKKVERGEISIAELERVIKPDSTYDSKGE